MNFTERMAEVISTIVWQPLATKEDIPKAAAKIIKLLLAELPEEEEGSRTNSHLDSKADGWNACLAKVRRKLK